jgi:hypothetical protein
VGSVLERARFDSVVAGVSKHHDLVLG